MHPGILLIAFAGNVVAGATHAVVAGVLVQRVGVAPLRHEGRQDAMERDAIILLLLDKADEVGDGIGSFILEEFEFDVPFVCLEEDPR